MCEYRLLFQAKSTNAMEQPSPLLDEALAAYQTGDLERAERLCQQLTESHRNDVRVWYLLSMIAHRQAKARLAAERIEKALERAGVSPKRRAETLSLEEWGALTQAVAELDSQATAE